MAMFIHIPDFGLALRGNFVLRGELIYSSDLVEIAIHVPKGFITDFASVPRFLRWLHPVNAKHREAAVVHDYLCREEGFSRKMADKIFLEGMKVLGVAGWRRRQMYIGVRIGSIFRSTKK